MTLKTVPLNDAHIELGAKMVEFAGYNMPLRYSSGVEEHHAVRETAGLFDVSHMGEFIFQGDKALDLLQKVTSNDVSRLSIGGIQYSCLPNEQNGIVDDVLVYKLEEEKYLMVVNASNIQKDWEWISRHNDMGADMRNVSDDYVLLALQGPKSLEIMKDLTDVPVGGMKYYTLLFGKVAGCENAMVSATGYTGASGFEILAPNQHAVTIWNALMEKGKPLGLKPCGLGARDTLRLEMGMCLYGNDIDETTSPIEAKLGWITKFTKSFINDEALKQQKEEGPARKLVAFKMIDRGIPRKGYEITDDEGQAIGEVTSGLQSPSLGIGIGMGYVKTSYAKPGTEIAIAVRKKTLKAEVVKPPFVK